MHVLKHGETPLVRSRISIVLACGVACYVVCALVVPAWPADSKSPPKPRTTRVDVRIDGIDNDLERNALESMSLYQRRSKLTEPEIHDLHEKAPAQIERALQPYGFYRPAIHSDLRQENKRWIAEYHVAPGPPLRIDSLSVRVTGEGAQQPVFNLLIERFPLHRGDVLDQPAYEAAKLRFTDAGLKLGYLDGRFSEHALRIDLDRYVATMDLEFDTGPQYRFGPVEFHQTAVDPRLLEGYITFKRGDPLDFDKLLELETSLSNSPYFSRVEVRPVRDTEFGNDLPIVVELTPAKAEKYTFGGGYGTDNGPHGRGIVELRRINRSGHRGEVEGTLSRIERSAAGKYSVPWPYPRTDVLTLSSGYKYTELPINIEETEFVGVGLSRLWAGWQENFGLNFRRETFHIGIDHGVGNLLVPDATWTRLQSDDPIDPRGGRRLRFTVAVSHTAVVSRTSFARAEAEGKWLRSFGPRSRLIGHLEAGSLWTDAFHELPPSFRFFAGGAQSVRGFGYNELGPRDSLGFVTGGEALALASIEYEYRFIRQFSAAVFYDIGNAMHHFGDPLEQGTGVGLRWVSPVGMVRVDYGIPLTRSKKSGELHLSIGPPL